MRLFPAIDAGDVTLVTVTGVNVDAAQRALQRSMSGLRFRQVKLIASAPPSRLDRRITHVPIAPMTLADYNRFIPHQLYRHVETTHVLIVQADGFVLNPRRWNPAWLELDYVGAPWPAQLAVDGVETTLRNRVGNGGFSLRSRRLLQLSSEFDLDSVPYPLSAEDMFTCNVMFDALLSKGIRFASPEAAARFSVETPGSTFGQTVRTSFGFHGTSFLPQVRRWWQRPIRLPNAEGPDRPGPLRRL